VGADCTHRGAWTVTTANVYKAALDSVVKAVTGGTNKKDNPAYIVASKLPWVKSLACDMATKLNSVELAEVDIQYPILESAYKAQKSKNSRDLEVKK